MKQKVSKTRFCLIHSGDFDAYKDEHVTLTPEEKVENVIDVMQTENFQGWKNWMEKNKEGLDCLVKIHREGNQVILQTENLGIRIQSISTIQECPENLYLALTGDQCAITNICVSNLE